MSFRNAAALKTVAAWLIGGLLALLAVYAAAGVIGGMIPSNADWREPAGGVEILVETNGIHTGIVVPKVAAGVDWRATFPPRDLADPRYGRFDHLAIGWGEKRFYLETATWADVRVATVLAAAFGSGETLVHVDHLPQLRVSETARRVVLRPEEYRRLAAFIRSTLVQGGGRHPGYGGYDAFYEARGRYDALRTCNAWVGEALRTAGVRVGAWTPFQETVMRWF